MQKFVNFNIDTTIDNSIEIEKRINKGDTLKFTIKVFNNGVLSNLTNDTVNLVLLKADGTVLEDVTTTKSNGIVTFDLSQQATLAENKVTGTLQITESSTSHLSTNVFTYFVNPSITDSVLEASQNEIKTLGELMVTIKDNTNIINEYSENIVAIAGTTESVQALVNIKTYIDANLPLLTSENDEAVTNIADETTKNNEAVTNVANLTSVNNTASTLKSGLEADIVTGGTLKSGLESDIASGNTLKSDLETQNTNATSNISSLTTKNSTATSNLNSLGIENTRAETNITAMQGFGDVTAVVQEVTSLKTEVETARNGEVSLDARLDKNDVLVASHTTELSDIALYGASCSYATNVYTLTLANTPTTLPNFYTVRFKAPSAWVDGSTIKIGTKIYTVANASFIINEVVTINIDEVALACFFKSGGGGGLTETLPQQVDTFTAVAGDSNINLTWSNSNTSNLTGYYIVYKTGVIPPNTVNDGTKIDITDINTTSKQLTGLTNDTTYSCRMYPYNSKKQVQAEYKVASGTPKGYLLISDLPNGAKVKGINPTNSQAITFIVMDKNHSGYPTNSTTLMTEYIQYSNTYGTNAFPSNTLNNWCINTFSSSLPLVLKNNLLTTTIKVATGYGTSTDYTQSVFMPSLQEVKNSSPTGTVAEGVYFDVFTTFPSLLITSASSGGSAVNWGLRTRHIISTGLNGQIDFITTTGVVSQANTNDTINVRPFFNVNSLNIQVLGQVDANGYYNLI